MLVRSAVLAGKVANSHMGRVLAISNVEFLGMIRQTETHPLLEPTVGSGESPGSFFSPAQTETLTGCFQG